ncbi:unnamed protein product [Cunninghamella blakesleeana]
MMFIKALGLSIFTLATLITVQGRPYPAVIQWGSNGQYVIPGNDTIDNSVAKYFISNNGQYYEITYLSPDDIMFVAVEGNKVTVKPSNVLTRFLINSDASGSPGNIIVASNEAEKQCWQVNDSTMLVEIAPCVSGNEKQLFLVKSPK